MLRVRDIMTTEVFTIEASATIETAASAFMSQFISGAPVVDDAGKPIGIVSESDILRHVFADHQESRKPVSSAMTPVIWTLGPDEPALRAVQWMLERRIHRVVVVEAPDKIVGIVSTMDVLKALDAGRSFAA
jgi:CBS domain-containing protein